MADILLVYWTGTGNTEMMAEKIKEGIESAGCSVDYRTVDAVDPNEIEAYDKIVFGCPSMGVEGLEESEFEPFFEEAKDLLNGKKVALFGSYGWGEGEWMDAWENRLKDTHAVLYKKGLSINSTPSSEEEEICFAFGRAFAAYE